MHQTAMTAREIEARLEAALELVQYSRYSAAPLASALAPLTRAEQEYVLRWAEVICKTNTDLAYQFVANAPQALSLMPPPTVDAWIIRAMDVYDREGLYPGCAILGRAALFAAEAAAAVNGVALEEMSHVLELFVQGLSGRKLRIDVADEPYTDTVSLFLPDRLHVFPTRDDNLRLYKATVALLWAQTWYGTFRLSARHADALPDLLERYPQPARALRVFNAFETMRLIACLARELPGLHRDLMALDDLSGWREERDGPWAQARQRLAAPGASVEDSAALLEAHYATEPPAPHCYEGVLHVELAERAMRERIARERDQFRVALARLRMEQAPRGGAVRASTPGRFELRALPDSQYPERHEFSLTLDGQPLAPGADVRALMDSIIQDLGNIPEDYLVAAGDGGYRADMDRTEGGTETTREQGVFLYNEWDHARSHYRKDWCVLREHNVSPQDEPFVERTLRKYAGVLPELRRTFEALRGEDRLLRRQLNGDDVDFDALVEAQVDMHRGRESGERLFIKRRRLERNIAVMFMVDMSGSTKGWINDAEREALVLLCEALEILGDRYAIYGFSGMTRMRCELYRVKRLDEPYNDEVRQRIAGILPKDYTRMGVTIRHLTYLLGEIEARTKLLITLSDGKPDDYDGYRGDYGIEDTRQALIEARNAGIHPFCITIDNEARDYLPHMYGAVNWTLVDDVRRLPLKVSDIYRRLTL
ncbi:MAG: hypothetical protein AMJ72_03555 [Acidithiobacillales bacterium SM1_46]|nr:MAG: hypothetical protein AMJ72_03555 [Acidithiobacillales bacterium SM1_46]